MAELSFRRNNLDQALDLYRKAQQQKSDDPTIHKKDRRCLSSNGSGALAVEAYKLYSWIESDSPDKPQIDSYLRMIQQEVILDIKKWRTATRHSKKNLGSRKFDVAVIGILGYSKNEISLAINQQTVGTFGDSKDLSLEISFSSLIKFKEIKEIELILLN